MEKFEFEHSAILRVPLGKRFRSGDFRYVTRFVLWNEVVRSMDENALGEIGVSESILAACYPSM